MNDGRARPAERAAARDRLTALVAGAREHVSAVASVGIRGLAVAAGFILTFLIGRTWGPAANGEYALFTQSALFLSVLAVGGLDLAAVREFTLPERGATTVSRHDYARLFLICGGLCALVVGGTVVASRFAVGQVAAITGGGSILIFAAMMVARAFTRMASATLRSQHRYLIGQAIEVLVIPMAVVLIFVGVRFTSVHQLLDVTSKVSVVAAVVGVALTLVYARPRADTVPHRVDMAAVARIAVPMWFVGMFLNLGDWWGLVVVAAQLGTHETGLYRVATQVASGFPIVTFGLFGVFSARFSAAMTQGDSVEFARLLRSAERLSIGLILPPAIIVLVFGHIILGLIGPEFVAAYPILAVAVVGQILYAYYGPSSWALALSGNQNISLAMTVTSVLALLVSIPLAAHYGGAIAVAACAAIAQVGRNIASAIYVRRAIRRGTLIG